MICSAEHCSVAVGSGIAVHKADKAEFEESKSTFRLRNDIVERRWG